MFFFGLKMKKVNNISLSVDPIQVSEKENGIEISETNLLNSSNQEPDTSGDWYEDNKFNLTCIPNENEEAKTTWKSRNLYSMPNSKFQAYWKDRFPDSIISKETEKFNGWSQVRENLQGGRYTGKTGK